MTMPTSKRAAAAALIGLCAIAAGAAHAAGGEPSTSQVDAAFAKADPDKDGTLTEAEARKFGIGKAAFKHADPDKDGTLDKAEFLAAIKYQFEKANRDKDGTLDAKEAGKAGVTSTRVFNSADADKDGTLDLAEYLQALTSKAK